MILEKCELTSRGFQILHKRGDSMRGSGKTVVPAHRFIEEPRPALSSVSVFRFGPGPRKEARHA